MRGESDPAPDTAPARGIAPRAGVFLRASLPDLARCETFANFVGMKSKKITCRLLAAALCAPVAFSALGWGQKGHDVIAEIASRHLTPVTAAAVDSLLGGSSMVYWSNWLDNASHTPEYAYTKSWHYKNIDPGETYENAPLYPDGDVVTALTDLRRSLASGTLDLTQSALALKMLVHLTGDLHQPLHMGRRNDRGGNDRRVFFFDTKTNLHSAWDTSLPEAAHRWSYSEWADQLDRATPDMERTLLEGDFSSWGRETYGIAAEVYEDTPEDAVISYDYVARWTPVVEHRFLSGGLRLAHVLNSIFDPAYNPAP